ncbi:hypothetical protein [Paenibacillus baimaensis]|uniref:hypothetical protein n=1 Tax=Paenibacillus baimaensis TaxID=2982185 RepID=UPI0021D298F2|nr:hypothetical protein [Paenibacillus sp. WQ 127069]
MLKWLSMDQSANQRWLFLHKYASTDLFQTVPLIFSKRFYGNRMNTKAEYYRTVSYHDDIYHQNRVCFLTVDRFLRKKLKQHRQCIRVLQELRKAEGEEEFPQICPYAYIFWRHTLIRSEKFYKDLKANDISPVCPSNFAIVTSLIQRVLESYRRELFNQTNMKEVDNRLLLHWIINRLTIQICINYFKQWIWLLLHVLNKKQYPIGML